MLRPRQKFDRRAAAIAAVLTLICLMLPLWHGSFPAPPTPLVLEVTFPRGIAGRGEPIGTTGRMRDGDFLAVRYVDEESAVLFYDVWGVGGPISRPFALQPGKRRRLEVEMPTLSHVAQVRSRERRPLRVLLDGEPLLDEPVYFHRREPAEIFIGLNPIGGSLVDVHFRGDLAWPNGRSVKGDASALFGRGARAVWMIQTEWRTILRNLTLAFLFGAAAGWLYPWRTRLRLPRRNHDRPRTQFPSHPVSPHTWFVATTVVSTITFAAVLTNGTFRMIAPDEFGNFYDLQARSFLEGRLSLPDSARNSESFIFEGRNYMYFGPTPAVLRLPFTIFNVAFGELSRCFMVAYFVGLLVDVYLLQIFVARLATRSNTWPSRFSVVLLVSTVGTGSTLFFLSARTYVYHEAIFCGAMFAVWSGYCSLRYLLEPQRRWWIGALVCGLCSVHARPPTGLFALALIGSAAVVVGIRSFLDARSGAADRSFSQRAATLRHPVFIGVLAAVCVLSFNGLSYLKFKSFEGAPLKYHVGYQHGRLEAIAGKNFHLSNFRYNFDAYMWRPDFAIERRFPFIYIRNPQDLYYPGIRIDLFEPTLAMPYTMPALVFLSLLAGTFTLVAWPEARSALGVIGAAGSVMALALFTAVAVSHRYTGDFCPALILSGAFGLQSFELLPDRWRKALMIFTAILAALGIAITIAITLHYQGAVVWGVPDEVKARYESLRTTVDHMLGLTR